jgi:hypothetical protein
MKKDKIQAWINERPAHIKEVANKYRPDMCYVAFNDAGLRGHYRIHSYEENKDGTVTLKVNHLLDSFLPGHRVFGFNPKDLKKCGCLFKSAVDLKS